MLGHISLMYVTNRKFGIVSSFQGKTIKRMLKSGAILAFVAILVALVFSITQGALRGAICAAFSAVVSQLNNLSSGAGNATS